MAPVSAIVGTIDNHYMYEGGLAVDFTTVPK